MLDFPSPVFWLLKSLSLGKNHCFRCSLEPIHTKHKFARWIMNPYESSCNIGPQTEWTRAERFCAGMEALGPSIHELTRQFLAKYGFLVFVLQWLHVARFPMEHVGNDVVVFQCTVDGGYYLQHRCGIEICTGRTGMGDCWKNRFCMVQSETILQARPIANLAKHSDDYRRHITMAYHDYRRHTIILSSMVCWHFLFHW